MSASKLAISLLVVVVGTCAIVSSADYTPTFGGPPPTAYNGGQQPYGDAGRHGSSYPPSSGGSHQAPYANGAPGPNGYPSNYPPTNYPSSHGPEPGYNSSPYAKPPKHGGYNPYPSRHGPEMISQHAKELAKSVLANSRPAFENLKKDIKHAMMRNAVSGATGSHGSQPGAKQGFGQKLVSGVMKKVARPGHGSSGAPAGYPPSTY